MEISKKEFQKIIKPLYLLDDKSREFLITALNGNFDKLQSQQPKKLTEEQIKQLGSHIGNENNESKQVIYCRNCGESQQPKQSEQLDMSIINSVNKIADEKKQEEEKECNHYWRPVVLNSESSCMQVCEFCQEQRLDPNFK